MPDDIYGLKWKEVNTGLIELALPHWLFFDTDFK